ncbi:hypothetical protein NE237_014170 [Protea cynaroides]|uniref:Uncharacterized protein n=1 Tax=Protea cynaroides TaxID=273540 RepID=A0A9Q0JT67_9MAGN|nr:hypothetical protein NE237_014170 [Protea cynaroides]
MPVGKRIGEICPGKSVFSNKSGVPDLRFGRSLALRKAKSKSYNLIKGSELKEVVLDLESGFEVRAESGRGLAKSAGKIGVLQQIQELRTSVFGRSFALRKAKSKGYNLIKGSELKEVVLDLESGFEVRAEVSACGTGLALRKAKSKGYNLIKGSELKEVVLDLESGFEVRAEVRRRRAEPVWVFRRPRGVLEVKKLQCRCVGNPKHGPKTFLKTLSSYQVVLRFKYSREEDWRNPPRKSVFSNKCGVTDLRFGRSLAFRKAKSKGYNLIKGSGT